MKKFSIVASLFVVGLSSSVFAAGTNRNSHTEPLSMQALNCKVGDQVRHTDDQFECAQKQGEWVSNSGRTALDANKEAWCKTFGFFCGK